MSVRRPEVGEQLELGATAKPRDVWVDMLEKEFGLILLPLIDKSYSVTMCREVAMRLAVLAAKRARYWGCSRRMRRGAIEWMFIGWNEMRA